MIAHGTPAGDEHVWVSSGAPECERCECCTAGLCEVGATLMGGCEDATSEAARDLVRGCPCSGEDTEGTVRHTLAVWHEHVEREVAQDSEAGTRLHAVFVERVLGPETARDPASAGLRLRELIDQLWPSAVGGT